MKRVVVRIVRRGDKFWVIGRKTSVVCDSFDEAWEESVLYNQGVKW